MSDSEEIFDSEAEEGAEEAEESQDEAADEEHEEEEEEAEEEEVEEEQEPEGPVNPLTEDVIRDTLTLLTRIGSGLQHAYVRLDIHERDLTDIELIKSYIHLRYVDISRNTIKDLSPLYSVSNLLTLKADSNSLSSARMDEMPYLQSVNFSNNSISSLEGIQHPMLEKLYLAFNDITEVVGLEPRKLPRLHMLDLRGNRLESSAGIYPQNLRELYLPSNMIRTIEGIDTLELLSVLHLRDNQIRKLEGFSSNMKRLEYVNIRGNMIEKFREVKKLKCLSQLKALVLTENPISENDLYRAEVLVALEIPKGLLRLDKEAVTEDDEDEARELRDQKAEEGQEEEEESENEAENEEEADNDEKEES